MKRKGTDFYVGKIKKSKSIDPPQIAVSENNF